MPAFIQIIQKTLAAIKHRLTASPQRLGSLKTDLPRKKTSTAPIKTAVPLPSTLQSEIRMQRKFSLAEAIGREGGSFMKGESTVPRPLRAVAQINQFITTHLSDSTSALSTTLQSWVCNDIRVSRHLDAPLVALDQVIASLLLEPTSFCELARQTAIAHSQITGDRPYFQLPNQPPHPESDYTHASIRAELTDLQQYLQSELQSGLQSELLP